MSSVAAQLHQIIHTCTYLSSHFLSSFLPPPPAHTVSFFFPCYNWRVGRGMRKGLRRSMCVRSEQPLAIMRTIY